MDRIAVIGFYSAVYSEPSSPPFHSISPFPSFHFTFSPAIFFAFRFLSIFPSPCFAATFYLLAVPSPRIAAISVPSGQVNPVQLWSRIHVTERWSLARVQWRNRDCSRDAFDGWNPCSIAIVGNWGRMVPFLNLHSVLQMRGILWLRFVWTWSFGVLNEDSGKGEGEVEGILIIAVIPR